MFCCLDLDQLSFSGSQVPVMAAAAPLVRFLAWGRILKSMGGATTLRGTGTRVLTQEMDGRSLAHSFIHSFVHSSDWLNLCLVTM